MGEELTMKNTKWEKDFDKDFDDLYGRNEVGFVNNFTSARYDEIKDFISKTISQELKKERERIEKCIPKEVDKFPNIYNEDEMTGWNHCIKEIRKDFPKE